jgi:glycosyltransferase involved in cell wall biosynthesis
MIRLFINGVAATAGGGLTYLRNVIPELAQQKEVEATILLNSSLRQEFRNLSNKNPSNITFLDAPDFLRAASRFIYEQTKLRSMVQQSGAHVLISSGNFALLTSPIPQILLSRNALYTSADFRRDLRARGDYVLWINTKMQAWMARQSIRCAHVTIAPSRAFAHELTEWTGREVKAVPHGFNEQVFLRDQSPLPPETQTLLADGAEGLRLLFVSHYNYYRNFETLFRAIPILKEKLRGKVKLFLTCRLNSENPGSYSAETASALIRDLDAQNNIVELGAIPYNSLHHLYRACQIYVTPAYAESFGHPLVEAMASGLPIVASDLPVHREICGHAALYFEKFSAEKLAECVLQVHQSPELAERLSKSGLARATEFSWTLHVERLLELAQTLANSARRKA